MTTTLCPRCAKRPLGPHPALSRVDDKTLICSLCGNDEALVMFMDNHRPQPTRSWPVATPFADEIERLEQTL